MKHGNAIAVGAVAGGAALVVALASAHAAEGSVVPRGGGSAPPHAQPQKKGAPSVVKSPFHGVSDAQWRAYLKALGEPGHQRRVSGRLGLGAFLFGYPRLADLGLARNVRRVDNQGKQVWAGDFIPPLSLALFLDDPRVQLRVMAVSAQDHAPKIKALYGTYAGKEIEGQKATISGLLAVAHRAGLKGLGSWLKNPGDRQKYPNTTAAYKAANGIF